MTILEEAPVVVTHERPAPPPMMHRLCCLDQSKTVCGTPRKSKESIRHDNPIDAVDCIVCDDIWHTSCHCPVENNVCPNPYRAGGPK